MNFKNWVKFLFMRKGSKVVTIDDPITDVQTVSYKLPSPHYAVTTHEWNHKISYSMEDVRFATRKEIKLGYRIDGNNP